MRILSLKVGQLGGDGQSKRKVEMEKADSNQKDFLGITRSPRLKDNPTLGRL